MNGVSTYAYLGLPHEIAIMIFTLTLIASLAPFVAGIDVGLFKVPRLPRPVRDKLRILGPVTFLVAILLFLPLWPNRSLAPEAQQVRWGPLDGKPPGILIISPKAKTIPWKALKNEIEKKILPQVIQVPHGSTAGLRDFQEKQNWIVQIVSPNGEAIASVWFGPDPAHHWAFDGLIRLGPGDGTTVWQTFQRYSDGSYRRQ